MFENGQCLRMEKIENKANSIFEKIGVQSWKSRQKEHLQIRVISGKMFHKLHLTIF